MVDSAALVVVPAKATPAPPRANARMLESMVSKLTEAVVYSLIGREQEVEEVDNLGEGRELKLLYISS